MGLRAPWGRMMVGEDLEITPKYPPQTAKSCQHCGAQRKLRGRLLGATTRRGWLPWHVRKVLTHFACNVHDRTGAVGGLEMTSNSISCRMDISNLSSAHNARPHGCPRICPHATVGSPIWHSGKVLTHFLCKLRTSIAMLSAIPGPAGVGVQPTLNGDLEMFSLGCCGCVSNRKNTGYRS